MALVTVTQFVKFVENWSSNVGMSAVVSNPLSLSRMPITRFPAAFRHGRSNADCARILTVALLLVTLPPAFATITEYLPESLRRAFKIVKFLVSAPDTRGPSASGEPFRHHW
jgi:hypothetical protein